MKPKNLSQLKKYLTVGMALELTDTNNKNHAKLGMIRIIAVKQSNAFMFEDRSWLGMGSTGEKATDFTFRDNGFTLFYDKDTPYEGYLTYEYRPHITNSIQI